MTTSNIAGGFHTTGLYPLSQDAIQLPRKCNFADKLITPNVVFTPFKSNPLEKLHVYTSRDIKAAEEPYNNRRPNCMINQIKGPKGTNSSVITVPLPNVFNIRL